MNKDHFEKLVARVGFSAVPERFRPLISNVALLIEDEAGSDSLLGLYQGVPLTERGEGYGILNLPDTITLYRKPILAEAVETGLSVERVIADTIWHEVAHHFGLDEYEVEAREARRAAIF